MKKVIACLLVPFFWVTILYSSIIDNFEVASSIKLLETWIQAQMDYRGLPGLSIGIVYDQELIWSKGFGYSNLEKKTPATPKTIYRIASITKLFTSTAIMQLRDEGKLQLDDPVVKHLSWFKINNRYLEAPIITIRHLLTHTSGLPREAAFPYWTDHKFPTREQIINSLPVQQTIYASETKYKYSNLGMAILGEIVATVSGESYENYVNKHILKPLEMTSTTVVLTEKLKTRLATGYGRRMSDGTRMIMPFTDAKGLIAAANMSSTVADLARFASLQFSSGNQILKESTLREMHRVHWLKPSWKSGRGLGFGVQRQGQRVIVGHSGWVAGYRTQFSFCPEEKIAVIVMTNADDGDPSLYVNQAFKLVAPAITKAVVPTPKVAKIDPTWYNYVGKYHDPWNWDYEVMILNNELVLYGYDYPPEDNPQQSIIQLTPEGEHTFRMTGENGNGELLIFELGSDGKVVRVKMGENYIYPNN